MREVTRVRVGVTCIVMAIAGGTGVRAQKLVPTIRGCHYIIVCDDQEKESAWSEDCKASM